MRELSQIKELFFTILTKVFFQKPALLVTIAPDKKYSIGYEIGSFQEVKIGRSKFLINDVKSCSSLMLMEISRSEEFDRGLLLLVTKEGNLLENLDENLSYIHNDFGLENLSYEIAVCENDGKTLCLYNSELSKEVLSVLVSNLTHKSLLHVSLLSL